MDYKTTEYDGIRLSEYNGTYSIEALRVKDDNFYQVWAKYKKNKVSIHAPTQGATAGDTVYC